MKKRILAFFVLLTLLVGNFEGIQPTTAYAATAESYPNFSKLSQSDKDLITQVNDSGIEIKNKSGQYLVINVYKRYGLVVYDNANVCTTSIGFGGTPLNHNGRIENRYLGYSKEGTLVSNDEYLNDGDKVIDSNSLLSQKWVSQNGMYESWRNTKPEVIKAMHTTPFISTDMVDNTNSSAYTLGDVLKKTVGSNYSDSTRSQYTNRSFMLSPLTISSNGSTKVVKKGAGGYFYNTLTYERKALEPKQSITFYKDAALTQMITEYTIPAGQETATVYAKVSTNASLQDVNLDYKESSFIQSVENFIVDTGSKFETLGKRSSITNYRDVYGVKAIELKRANYTRSYKNFSISGKAVVEPTSVVINISKEIKSSGTLKVRVEDPSGLAPDFDIVYDNQVVTDQSVQNDGTSITKDFSFDLKDKTFVPVGNSIKDYNYFIYNHVKGDYDYFGYTKDSQFTLKADKVSEYISNDTLTFKQLVVDVANKLYTIEHTVSIINKGEALKPPKAYIFPPGSIRAGEMTRITGKGESGTGSIISYDFDLGSSYFVTSSKAQERNGTFLDYDTTETSNLTVTDSSSLTATASETTKVEHPIIPVMKTNGVYKVNRTIELDSTESRGTEFYPIDYVTWTIKPLEGQNLDNIKLHDGGSVVGDTKKVVGEKPKVDFKQLGRYGVWMDVHSTCTFSGQTHRTAVKQVYGIINIKPDEPPIAMLSVPSKVIRESDPTLLKRAYFDIWDMSYSPDGDSIGKRRYFYRFDSDNDKSLSDESWTLIYEGEEDRYGFDTPQVGNYEFRVEVEELNDSISSPYWHADTDTLRADTDGQSQGEKVTEVINVAPITSVLADRKKLDLIVATDYEGSDVSVLKSNLDLLVKDLYEQGIDIQVKLVSGKVKSGSYQAPIYKYTRYGDLSYNVTWAVDNGKQKATPYTQLERKEWEVRNLYEEDYKPNYGTEIPSSIQYNKGVNESGDGYTSIATKGTISAPEDPFKKNGTFYIAEVFGNGLSAFQYVFDTIKFNLKGYFEKGDITGFGNKDLYTLDLEKVKATPLREGADKKLVFITQQGNSLVTLNDSFKEWVKANAIEVSTVTGGNVKDEYGYGEIRDIGLSNTGFYFQTEQKQTYKIGDAVPSANMTTAYPIPSSYTFDNKPISVFLNNEFTSDYEYSSSMNGSERPLPTKNNPSYLYGRAFYAEGNSWYFDNQYVAGSAKYWVPLSDYAVALVSNNQTTVITYNYYSYVDGYWNPPSIIYTNGTSTDFNRTVIPSELNVKQLAFYNTWLWQDRDGRDSWDPHSEIRGSFLAGFKNGDVYAFDLQGATSDVYYREFYDYDKERTRSMGPLSTNYIRYSSSKVGTGQFLVYGYRHKTDGSKTRYRTIFANGQTVSVSDLQYANSSETTIYNQFSSAPKFAYPTKPVKIIADGLKDINGYMVVLGENGKVYATGGSNAMRYGINAYVNMYNPIKEYRSIANTSPVSLHELLGLSTQSRAYPSFTDFRTGIVSQYSATAYQATLTRLLGDTLDQQVMYADYENDPLYASSIQLDHDQSALENPLGTDPDSGKTLENWDGLLDKTGLYTLHPKVQDSPSDDDRFTDYRLWNKDDMTLKVLVHRKPIAKQKLAMASHGTDETKLVLTARDNGSLDLDHASEAQKGIVAVEWGFKAIYDSAWQTTNGSLGTQITKDMIRGDTYQVSYRVKDKEGEWSDPVVREILAGTNFLLDAKMKAKDPNQNLTKFPSGSYVTLTNVWTSYELAHHLEVQLYDGTTPIGSKQVINKSAASTSSEDFPEVNWKDIDFLIAKGSVQEKTYKVRITAVDTATPSVTRVKEFPVTIVNNTPPKVEFSHYSPAELYEGDSHQVKITVTDPDQDLLSLKVYMCYLGETEVLYESFSNLASGTTVAVKPLIIKDGQQIKWRAVLSDGSATDEALLQLPIKSLGIEQVDIQGAWNHWRGQTNAFGIKMSNEPYRFLSYEEINVTVVTRGNPERVLMRLSPALEAMSFKDEKGKMYRYKDEIGYEVAFPIIFRSTNVNKFNIEYILPLAGSTIGWNNQRRLPPYQLEIGIEKAGRLHWTVYGDEAGEPKIDITGNIFDLQFNQPRGAK